MHYTVVGALYSSVQFDQLRSIWLITIHKPISNRINKLFRERVRWNELQQIGVEYVYIKHGYIGTSWGRSTYLQRLYSSKSFVKTIIYYSTVLRLVLSYDYTVQNNYCSIYECEII